MSVTIKKKPIEAAAAASAGPSPEPGAHFVQKVIKGDTYLVLAASQLEPEDQFIGLYYTTTDAAKVMLAPPFDPSVLINFTNTNNILSQCIDAMETNVDGTGSESVPAIQGKQSDSKEEAEMLGFFSEPFPGVSYITLRRILRRQLEQVGWGFLEVLRAIDTTVVAVRNILVQTIRLVKLDLPVEIERTVVRNGKEIKLTMWERERRFAQKIGTTIIYFREFGSSRQLNRRTGEWETLDKPVAIEDRATELLYFIVNPDPWTPYGLPRWINNLPAVIGSRKAEEQNLDFFDAGGVPPAIVFIQGGLLGKSVSDQLRQYLSGQMKSKNRAVVVDVQSSSGSLEASGTVSVKVERFGSEKMQDGLFQNYDHGCEDHVRKAFRLPPMFIGASGDYSFATAATSYQVAEAQVFQPERLRFDEIINNTIVKALGFKTCRMKSLPVTMKDTNLQMEALALVQMKISPEELIDETNKVSGLSIDKDEIVDPVEAAKQQGEADLAGALAGPMGPNAPMSIKAPMGVKPTPGMAANAGGKAPPKPAKPDGSVMPNKVSMTAQATANNDKAAAKGQDSKTPKQNKNKAESTSEMVALAHSYAVMKGYIASKFEQSEADQFEIQAAVDALTEDEQGVLTDLMGVFTFGTYDEANRALFEPITPAVE